jgi:hypothetical protein
MLERRMLHRVQLVLRASVETLPDQNAKTKHLSHSKQEW